MNRNRLSWVAFATYVLILELACILLMLLGFDVASNVLQSRPVPESELTWLAIVLGFVLAIFFVPLALKNSGLRMGSEFRAVPRDIRLAVIGWIVSALLGAIIAVLLHSVGLT